MTETEVAEGGETSWISAALKVEEMQLSIC